MMGDDPTGVRVRGLDHVVLRVADPEESVRWYVELLGLEAEQLEEWRRGEVLFPSVRIGPATIIDFLAAERSGENMDHVCLVIDGPLSQITGDDRFEVETGPVQVSGARGTGDSVYVVDPDGNRVELRVYPDRP
jgi:catechol 2,3-dioxygenase-like lactoylglutathione lyase family enzyme